MKIIQSIRTSFERRTPTKRTPPISTIIRVEPPDFFLLKVKNTSNHVSNTLKVTVGVPHCFQNNFKIHLSNLSSTLGKKNRDQYQKHFASLIKYDKTRAAYH